MVINGEPIYSGPWKNTVKVVNGTTPAVEIPITESTRATSYVYRRAGIEELVEVAKYYKSKGIPAIVYGVTSRDKETKYAVFTVKREEEPNYED